jgi:hypothetical protein
MSTPSGTVAFLVQLKAIADAAFGATSVVEVTLGPSNSQDDTMQRLWIGITNPDEIAEAATADQEWPYASGNFRREELAAHCLATAWNGDDDFLQAATDAFAQVKVFTDAIVADASLSGAVLMARSAVSQGSLSWGYNPAGGAQAVVAFDVTAMQQFQN